MIVMEIKEQLGFMGLHWHEIVYLPSNDVGYVLDRDINLLECYRCSVDDLMDCFRFFEILLTINRGKIQVYPFENYNCSVI